MSIERNPTYQWTIDISWKIAAAALPLLFQLWIWSPILSRGIVMGNAVALLGMAYVVQLFSRSTLRISPEGVSSSGVTRFRVPWENVKTIRLVPFFGSLTPSLQLVFHHPVSLSWLRKNTKAVSVGVPSVPSLQLYKILMRFVGEERIDPKLKEFVNRPVSKAKLLILLLLHVPLAACWLFFIFRNQDLTFPSGFKYLMDSMLVIILLGILRQLLLLHLRWYEPESLLGEVRGLFVTGSVHIVLSIVIGFRSDLPFLVSIYLFLWFVVSLEAFGLLQILRYFTKMISPYWGFALLPGFLLFPGKNLWWEVNHVEAVTVASRERTPEDARFQSNLPQHVVWPDGRSAVFDPLPGTDRAQLLFFSDDLEVLSRVEVPAGFPASAHEEWVLWASRDNEEKRCCHYIRFGTGKDCRSLTAFRLIPSLRTAFGTDTVFGYYGETDAKMVVVSSADLGTGSRTELFQTTRFLQAVQTGPDTLLLAHEGDTCVTVSQYSVSEGNQVVAEVPNPAGDSDCDVRLSSNLSHVCFSSRSGAGTTIIRIKDGKKWRVPISSVGAEWYPPYVCNFSLKEGGVHVFKLHENGFCEEILSIENELFRTQSTFSPDGRFLMSCRNQILGTKQIIRNLDSGERRELLTHQEAVFWNFRPDQTQWSQTSFYYLSHPMFLAKTQLVKVCVEDI